MKVTRSVFILVLVGTEVNLTFFFKSCELGAWVEHENTQVVQTCWAVMSLMYAKYPYPEPIEKGVRLVMSRQRPVSFSSHFIFRYHSFSSHVSFSYIGWFLASRSNRGHI